MNPLQLLYEKSGLPDADIGEALSRTYGGRLGLGPSTVYANFVASVDGVVALPGPLESGRLVSGGNEADRFVMALLRGFADAVMVGAGTFRRAEGDLWYPTSVYPEAAAGLEELRARLGLRAQPLFVVVTNSGVIDPTQQALDGCLVLTSPKGELRLRGLLPPSASVAVLDEKPMAAASMLQVLRQVGLRRILVEGGPTLLGHFMRAGLIEELFLTQSPRLFGRPPGSQRKSLLEGADLSGSWLELMSLRRHASYLFARYRVQGGSPPVGTIQADSLA